MTVRDKAVVTDAHKALGQDVHQESPQELGGSQSHHPPPTAVSVVLPDERDVPVAQGDEAVVGYRCSVSVVRQVAQHVFGAAEGALGINDPVLLVEGREPLPEPGALGQLGSAVVELEQALVVGSPQSSEELPSEETAEDVYGEKEAVSAVLPVRPVSRDAAAGDDAVDVGMVLEVLAPGVQDGQDRDFGTEVLGRGGDLAEGLSRRLEQDVVDDPLVLERDRGDFRLSCTFSGSSEPRIGPESRDTLCWSPIPGGDQVDGL